MSTTGRAPSSESAGSLPSSSTWPKADDRHPDPDPDPDPFTLLVKRAFSTSPNCLSFNRMDTLVMTDMLISRTRLET